jgi:uncharacterized SAM-dependent methyltransferase
MESYLVSKKPQSVTVSGCKFELAAWEAIHTEVSCKYSEAHVSELLAAAGLSTVAWFTDAQRQFVDVACMPAAIGSTWPWDHGAAR